MTNAELERKLRAEILEVITAALSAHFDLDPKAQIEYISANEITLPLVDADGNDKWPVLKVSCPRGERNGAGGYIPFDGHAAAEAYQQELADKAAKKEANKNKSKKKKEEAAE